MTASPADNPSGMNPRWSHNPFASHIHLPNPTVEVGSARMEFVVEEIHLRPGGIVHGGMYATLLDTITGFAAYSSAPKGHEVLTMQLNMNMTFTAKLGDRLIATANVLHSGKRTSVVNGEIRLADGKLVATGSGTFFFLEGKIAT